MNIHQPSHRSTSDEFSLGTSTVPCGQQGAWSLEEFEVSEKEARFFNVRASFKPGGRFMMVRPGRYKRLKHASRGVVMSNTPMEVMTNRQALNASRGFVLINGLGMGMLLEAVLAKPEVKRVRVVEIDEDVISLVGPHFAHDPRVEIVHADAHAYQPPKEDRYDFVWHDIWDAISADNLESMKALTRKYRRPRAANQACWARDLIGVVG